MFKLGGSGSQVGALSTSIFSNLPPSLTPSTPPSLLIQQLIWSSSLFLCHRLLVSDGEVLCPQTKDSPHALIRSGARPVYVFVCVHMTHTQEVSMVYHEIYCVRTTERQTEADNERASAYTTALRNLKVSA